MSKFSREIFLLIFSLGICLLVFGKFFTQANDFLFVSGGDGIKNYFTPAWYLKFDSNTHFSGMNHPFGEHVVYTDNQPALSYILNLIDDYIYPLRFKISGILNLLMILSIPITILLMYRINLFYRLPPWFAAVSAMIIGLMSPQIERTTMGHYALAYCFFVPLIWWMWIRAFKSENSKNWLIALALVQVFFGLVHMYYLLLGALFFLALALVYFFGKYKQNNNKRKLWSALITGVVPLILVMLFIKITDPISDRPITPWGFFTYKASFESVFLPVKGPFLDLWSTLIDIRKPNYEGYAYVGFTGLLTLVFLFFYFIKKGRRIGIKRIKIPLPKDFAKVLIAAFLVLFFSMALPFSLGLQSVFDYLGPLKQFRSPGRFAWLFYYVFTCFAAIYFYRVYRWFKIKGKHKKAIALLTFFFVSGGIEAYFHLTPFYQFTHQREDKNPFKFGSMEYVDLLKDNGLAAIDFQGILTLPYSLMGSEQLYISRSNYTIGKGMVAAWQTGLPLVQGMMSRTSLSQTLELAQLLSNPAIEKDLLKRLTDKNILLLASDEDMTTVENNLIQQSALLGKVGSISVYKTPISAFGHIKEALKFKAEMILAGHADSLEISNSSPILHLDFEDNPHRHAMNGTGAAYQKNGPLEICREMIDAEDTLDVRLSLWIKAELRTTAFPNLKLNVFDQNGKQIEAKTMIPKYSSEIYDEWVMVEEELTLLPGQNHLGLWTEGKEILVDELLIRQKGLNCYYGFDEEGFRYNNFPISWKD